MRDGGQASMQVTEWKSPCSASRGGNKAIRKRTGLNKNKTRPAKMDWPLWCFFFFFAPADGGLLLRRGLVVVVREGGTGTGGLKDGWMDGRTMDGRVSVRRIVDLGQECR